MISVMKVGYTEVIDLSSQFYVISEKVNCVKMRVDFVQVFVLLL